jgi:radical SAM-linked protein
MSAEPRTKNPERVLLRLQKGDEVKYLSHLDFIRAFEQALRRARIPVEYSAGFNPRPRMSFGSAVGVGVTSDDERIILELAEPMAASEVKEALNSMLPGGIEVLKAEALPEGTKRIVTTGSQFRLTVQGDSSAIEKAVGELLESKEIPVTRVRENRTKQTDLRPNLIEARVTGSDGDSVALEIGLRSGDSGGARPQDFMQALQQKVPNIVLLSVHRIKQL